MLYNIANFFQPAKLAHTSARGLDLILLKSSNLEDYAGLTVNIDSVTYDFATQLSEWVSLGNRGIITKNSNYCDQALFQNIQSSFYGSSNAVWVHIWENPEEDEDIVFLKIKKETDEEDIPPGNFDYELYTADPPPPFEYTIVHRTFAPWDRFGHLPIAPNIHLNRNCFHGDNRGFSLDDSDREPPGTTARIHQQIRVKLGVGEVITEEEDITWSSRTTGYLNFIKQKIKRNSVPMPYNEPVGSWEYEPVAEQVDYCDPGGYAIAESNDDKLFTFMYFKGSDPLVVFPLFAPNIKWYLQLGLYYTNDDSALNIDGLLRGKSFPAYEAYIEDNCGNRMFLYTYSSPCESELAAELLNPAIDYNERFGISISVDEYGCFLSSVTTAYNGDTLSTDLNSWNQTNLIKEAGKDCPNTPCQGAYPNDGSDKTNDFDCGN